MSSNPLNRRFLSRERPQVAKLRGELVAGLTGTVIDIGAGDGIGFPFYPNSVQQVIAVEPNPSFRELAAQAAAHAPVNISVIPGTAEHLPVGEAVADAVVVSWVLCAVSDPQQALAEIQRVLKPDGELRVFEHVGARNPLGQAALKAAEATFWRRMFGNCDPTRHTATAIAQAGFDVSELRRFAMQATPGEPPLPYIHGIARRIEHLDGI
jgi:ubiquinone/menaquinone biosynthesis C-methylase UbiE